MPRTNVKTGARPSHWSSVSDERLIDLDLEIDNPEALERLVRQVPANYEDTEATSTGRIRYERRRRAIHGGLDVRQNHLQRGL